MVHSISSENPDVMSLTWNPRLVKTPTPTMSATTMAVAVTQDTEAIGAPAEAGSVMTFIPLRRHYDGRPAQTHRVFSFPHKINWGRHRSGLRGACGRVRGAARLIVGGTAVCRPFGARPGRRPGHASA